MGGRGAADTVLSCGGFQRVAAHRGGGGAADRLSEEEIAEHLARAAVTCMGPQCGRAPLELMVTAGLDARRATICYILEALGSLSFEQGLLHVACGLHSSQEAAAFFIEQGCDPLEADDKGLMPRHMAAAQGGLQLL